MAALSDCSPSPSTLVADAGYFYLIFEQRLIPSSSSPASPSFLEFDSLSLKSRAHAQRGSMWGILLNRGEARRLMTFLRDLVAVRATAEVPSGAERACLESAKHARRFLSVLASQLPVDQSPSASNQQRSSLTRNKNSDLFWTVEVDNVDRQQILSLFDTLITQPMEDPAASMYSDRSGSSLGLSSGHIGLAAFGDGSWVAEHNDSGRSRALSLSGRLHRSTRHGSSSGRSEGGYASDRDHGSLDRSVSLGVAEHMDGSWVAGHVESSRHNTPPLGSAPEGRHLDHGDRRSPLSTDRTLLPPRINLSRSSDGMHGSYLSGTRGTVPSDRLLPSPMSAGDGYLSRSAIGLSRPSWEDDLADHRRPRAMGVAGEEYPSLSYAGGSAQNGRGQSISLEAWAQ